LRCTYNAMVAFVLYVVLVSGENLDRWVLRIYLALHETLQRFRDPHVESDLAIDGSNLKAEMLLDAGVAAQLIFVSEDTVKAREHLLSRKLRLVVRARNFKR